MKAIQQTVYTRFKTPPPPPLNDDIQVITKPSKKRTMGSQVAFASPKKAKPKRKKKNSDRQMKLL